MTGVQTCALPILCGKQLFHWVKKLEIPGTSHQEIERYLPEIKNRLAGLDREELLRRVVTLEFDRFLDDYRNGVDIIEPVYERESRGRGSDRKGGRGQSDERYTRLFINLGKSDGFFPEQLIEFVNSYTKGKKVPIGKIDLLKTFSFFEIEESWTEYVISKLNNRQFMDRKVSVEIAQEKSPKSSDDRHEGKREKWSDRKQGGKRHDKQPGFFKRGNSSDRNRKKKNYR